MKAASPLPYFHVMPGQSSIHSDREQWSWGSKWGGSGGPGSAPLPITPGLPEPLPLRPGLGWVI